MGRATSGVIGMRFNGGDELLAMEVVGPSRASDVEILVATEGGFAKRTRIDEYPIQGRGGKGVLTARIVSTRGGLVGAVAVSPEDEIYAITSDGVVIRTKAAEVRRAQRQTMGVRLMNLPDGVNSGRPGPQRRRAGRAGVGAMTQPPYGRECFAADAVDRPAIGCAVDVPQRHQARPGAAGAPDRNRRPGRRLRCDHHLRQSAAARLVPAASSVATAAAHHRHPGNRARVVKRPAGVPGRPSQPVAGRPRRRPPAGGRAPRPRRARLQLRHISPLTVLKFSCVLAIALFFVWLIIVGVLYGVLDAAGVIEKINDAVVQLNGSGSKPPITAGIVFGGAAIVGVVNIVLFMALSTVGSVIYNLCADLVGGIEITLSERR